MKKILMTSFLLLSACTCPRDEIIEQKEIHYGNEQQMIELQNLSTRELVICKTDGNRTAEKCAVMFEDYGFVRLREIPYKTAKYDILQTDTYPTRRWRDGEKTPRW